ncbi:4-hydroxybenzoate octaprenyltransferase [Alkalibaculum sp. M08DMB]|uniref:4-hydroxybenzoate polyprenyltransferase n=1 Tax=Alkalibaculum sporogenes TaxID=2655001 RepID=A0A6A7KBW3_9FIRM|nr:UbiA-like polyprenyltransferase [Alkalibaculum sporogenes]MPW26904.1 4-hydroxybenzoate octaprenyltransferase [Alkalibaculum sporogenes]
MNLIYKIKQYGELVMFSHTLFSFPFAMVAMIWAAKGIPDAYTLFWILVALITGRNGANAINRVIDIEYDKKNPRVANRLIPQGKVSIREALILSMVLFIIFAGAAYMINPLCFALSPVALGLFILYSYTKRFTWACHIILGIICAGAPFGAWIAVTGQVSYVPFLLSAAVALWIGGFDIIYGTQDIEFDTQEGLQSIPAKFGLNNSLLIAKLFHAMSVLILFSLSFIQGTQWLYLTGLVIISILFMIEHKMVEPKNTGVMNWASYHINQIVSVTFLVFSLLDFYIL